MYNRLVQLTCFNSCVDSVKWLFKL